MFRELITRPITTVVALVELPATVHRSLRQANDLMEQSQRQLEAMQTQTDEALRQAERMNDLLTKVVRLTEPLEYAQRGGEHVAGRLKRALFGEEELERAVEEEKAEAEWKPAAEPDGGDDGGIEITDSGTVRVIPNRPPPGEPAPGE